MQLIMSQCFRSMKGSDAIKRRLVERQNFHVRLLFVRSSTCRSLHYHMQNQRRTGWCIWVLFSFFFYFLDRFLFCLPLFFESHWGLFETVVAGWLHSFLPFISFWDAQRFFTRFMSLILVFSPAYYLQQAQRIYLFSENTELNRNFVDYVSIPLARCHSSGI